MAAAETENCPWLRLYLLFVSRRQMLAHAVDRVLNPAAEARVLAVGHHQAVDGAGHGHVEQACLVDFLFALSRYFAQAGDQHQAELQALARMHADDLDRILAAIQCAP